MGCLTERKKRLLMFADPDVPPWYKKVDFLVSIGQGAHIDTGVSGNDSSLEFDLIFYAETQVNYAGIMGNYVNSTTQAWRVILGSNNTSIITNCFRQSGTTLYPNGGTSIGTKLRVHFNESSTTVYDSSGSYSKTPSGTAGSVNTGNIALGRFTITPNITNPNTNRMRIYGCKIWSNGQLVRDYIPCIRNSDNLTGFWDRVNKTFTSSCSSYNFDYGNDT